MINLVIIENDNNNIQKSINIHRKLENSGKCFKTNFDAWEGSNLC